MNDSSLLGVGPGPADKLIDVGFDFYEALAVASPGELSTTIDLQV